MRRALVCGAGGFIGGHLVKKLKKEGFWVRGVDIKEHEFAPTAADEFLLLDLREPENCEAALSLEDGTFEEVYQLAADMGGMGFISFFTAVVATRAVFEVIADTRLLREERFLGLKQRQINWNFDWVGRWRLWLAISFIPILIGMGFRILYHLVNL